MRLVSINIVDIGAEASDGDRVLIRSAMTRVSSVDPTRIVTPAEVTINLVDGQATVELDPGPADVFFRCRNIKGGGPYHINVPEGAGTVHLADLLKQHYPYSPPVVNAAYQYSLDAAASAAAAQTSETNADSSEAAAASSASSALSSKNAAATSATGAANSATAAGTSATNAASSATSADASKTAAATSATNAATSATDASASASAATEAADRAAGSESQAASSASAAAGAATRAEGVADAFGSLEGVVDQVQAAADAAVSASDSAASASSSAIAAASSAGNAADSQIAAGEHSVDAASAASAAAGSASAATEATDRAAGSESQAASSASAAASSAAAADSAATRAEAVADSTHWQDDRLSVMGQLGPSLKGPKGDKGDPGDGAGDVLWSELNPVLDGKAAVSHDHTIASITGLQDELDGKAPASHQHSWGDVTGKPSTYPPESHSHPSTDISDSTSTGRAVLTASDATAARGVIGAGTSNLALGTTSSTAKAGNYQPTAADISDATTAGRAVLKAATTAAARTAIGAGTSNLALGTTSTTAKAGDWKPAAADITDLPTISSTAVADSLVQRSPTGNVLVADTPSGPSSATSQTYVQSYVASQLGQAGSTIVPVEELPANPSPTTFYAVMGPGVVPEPTALATYQMVGTPTAGQDFPGTAVPSSFGFASNPGGWYAGATHGLTPPVAGLYTIKVTADPANGPVSIYPYVNGAWGTAIAGTGATATATLQLTTTDAVYYDVVPTTGGVPVTITVKAYAGSV